MVDFFYWLFDIGYKHSSGTLPADSGTGPSWPCSSTQGRKRRKRRTEVARPGLLDGAGRFGAQRAGPSSGRLRPPLLTTGGPHRDLAGGWAQPAKHRESPRLRPSSPTAEPLPVPRKGRLLHADPDLSGPHGVHGKVPGQRAAAKRLRFSQGCTAAPALSRVCVAAPVLSRERVAAPALGWECVAAPALSREGAAAPGLSRACLAASVLDWEWEAATALSRECVTAPALSREGAAAPVPSGECGRGEVWVSAGERTRRGGCTHQESQGARDREWPPDAEWTAADAKGVLRGGLSFASPERTGHPCFASPFQKGRHGPSFAYLSERRARRHSQELQEDALSLRSGSVFPRTVATTALARSARGECESPRSRHRCRPRKPSRHRRQDRTIGPPPGSASAARSAPQLLIAGGQDLAESGSSTGEAPVTTRSRSTRVGTKGTRSAPRSPSAPSRG